VIDSAIEAHGGARIAVPGGEAAGVLFDALLAKPVDWSKVTLVPTDDRLVALDDAASAYGRLDRLFGAKGATIVSLIDESALDDHREAGRLADARLALLDWPFDLVWLAMGEGGATASIYPGPDLDRAVAGPKERRAVGVRPDPASGGAPDDRVTLTGAALASARTVMVVIAGDAKKTVLEAAIEEGPLSAKPIGRLIAEIEVPIDIYWSA